MTSAPVETTPSTPPRSASAATPPTAARSVVQVYLWLLNRTGIAWVATEIVIKGGIALVGSTCEAMLIDLLRDEVGRRKSYKDRTRRLKQRTVGRNKRQLGDSRAARAPARRSACSSCNRRPSVRRGRASDPPRCARVSRLSPRFVAPPEAEKRAPRAPSCPAIAPAQRCRHGAGRARAARVRPSAGACASRPRFGPGRRSGRRRRGGAAHIASGRRTQRFTARRAPACARARSPRSRAPSARPARPGGRRFP